MGDSETVRSTIQKRDDKGVVRHGAEWLTLWSDPASVQTKDERREAALRDRRRAALRHHLAAAGRSLADAPRLELALGELARSDAALSPERLPALRGEIDSRALKFRYHDAELHARLAPADPLERRLFDLCETLRCEALGAARFPGVRDNIVAAHLRRLEEHDLVNAHLASLIPLAEGLRMVLRDTLMDQPDPSIASSGFWMWDRWLRARIAPELAACRAAIDDQTAFASAAKTLIAALFLALESRAEGPERRTRSRERGDTGEEDGVADADFAVEDSLELDPESPGESIFADEEGLRADEALEIADAPEPPPYRVFTRAHDAVVAAAALAAPEALRKARERLDEKRSEYRRDLARLVSQLQRRLMARQTRAWQFDLEEGLIDASRLDRVIVNPGFADAYKQEEDTEFRDTAVTLLIDNSGSMRGKPIEIACVVADLVAQALERCTVTTEILGFTTAAFKGGRSAADWAAAGRPDNPGRLNDLRHIVYKSADEPLRAARNAICAMLDGGLLKENIDGEALQWAARRLAQRPEARKVLIVVSDGAPVDEATLNANDDKALLDRHLHQVVDDIARAGQIQLAAIGVKHDVTRHYRIASAIDRIEDLGPALVSLLDRLIAR